MAKVGVRVTHVEECFEWDEAKNDLCMDEHGIDFYAARQIWGGFYLPVRVKRRFLRTMPDGSQVREKRWKAIGTVQGELWTALYTLRHGRIRIITCRPANDRERSEYGRRLDG